MCVHDSGVFMISDRDAKWGSPVSFPFYHVVVPQVIHNSYPNLGGSWPNTFKQSIGSGDQVEVRQGKVGGGRVQATTRGRPSGRETGEGGWWEGISYYTQETKWKGDRVGGWREGTSYYTWETKWKGDRGRWVVGGYKLATTRGRPSGRETGEGGWWEGTSYYTWETKWKGDRGRWVVGGYKLLHVGDQVEGRQGKVGGGRVQATTRGRPSGRETGEGGWWEGTSYYTWETKWKGDRGRWVVGGYKLLHVGDQVEGR